MRELGLQLALHCRHLLQVRVSLGLITVYRIFSPKWDFSNKFIFKINFLEMMGKILKWRSIHFKIRAMIRR